MVRAFAASKGILRAFSAQNQAADGVNNAPLAEPTDPLLDRVVPSLVAAFLVIALTSMFVQFTSTRHDVLKAGEQSLAVAAQLIATDANNRQLIGTEAAGAVGELPDDVKLIGRVFAILDGEGRVLAANPTVIGRGQPAANLFLQGRTAMDATRGPGVHRLDLIDGRLASVVLKPVPGGQFLLAYQPVEDELIAWRHHAYLIASLLLAFGAVTIAFSVAFYLQRARARQTRQSAERLFNRFEVALDRGNVGLWDCKLGSDQVWLSNSMFRLIGLEGAERQVARQAIEAMIHPDDMSPLRAMEAIESQAGEVDHIFRMRHAERGWIWLHMRAARLAETGGRKGRLLGIVMDVTAEREAAAEHERAELRLRDAIESISEAFVLWDENNRLLLCNSKYRSFHGLDDAAAERGTRYGAVMAQAHEPRIVIEVERSIEDSKARAYEAQFEDGRWLLISERPTSAGGYVSVGTDITARKQQEERLIENERQLRITIADLAASREALRKQAHELAELADLYRDQKAEVLSATRLKAEFLANMNHEIRTPLNAILGFAQVIEDEVMGPITCGKYRDYATHIRESGANLLVIIDDILEMAHIEAGRVSIDRSSQAIGDILEEAATAVALDAATKDVRIEVDPSISEPAGTRRIDIDPRATGQALVHLARNAIRLSPRGGTVTMRARMQGEHINIFISDRGCHLSESDIGTITKPFGHIDGMLQDGCKGSGLSVAIARGLIELQGGTLRIRSAPQLGALTMIHLPIAPRPTQLDLPMAH